MLFKLIYCFDSPEGTRAVLQVTWLYCPEEWNVLCSALMVLLQQVFQLWEVTPKSEQGPLMLSGKCCQVWTLQISDFLLEHSRKEKGCYTKDNDFSKGQDPLQIRVYIFLHSTSAWISEQYKNAVEYIEIFSLSCLKMRICFLGIWSWSVCSEWIMIPCVFCVSLTSNKDIFVLQKYQVPGMQECFLEEKLKGLLIHSCRSVNVALNGKRQISFWNLHGNVEMSVFKGFHSL